MTIGGLGLAFLAGLLSILSPCVLPLLPLVLGAAASEHKFGPPLLASGVALSFVAIGLFVATIGFGLGLDGDVFRNGAAALMILFGVLLAAPVLQLRVAAAGGPLSDWVVRRFGGILHERGFRPVRGRPPAWRGLEPLCGPDSWRRVGARRTRRRYWSGRAHNGGVWAWRGFSVIGARARVATGDDAMARPSALDGQRRQSHSRRDARRDRLANYVPSRQETGSGSRRSFT